MSLEAVWDLKAVRSGSDASSLSPRSTCVYVAPSPPDSSSASTAGSPVPTNPFDQPSPTNSNPNDPTYNHKDGPQAVIFGCEQGSLHYRTYPSPTGGNVNVLQPPLGVTPSGRPPANVSRAYFPVDLPRNALPGPVVSVIMASPPSPSQLLSSGAATSASSAASTAAAAALLLASRPVFLVLVDDQHGTTGPSGGAYAATWVTLQNGNFSKLSNNSSSMHQTRHGGSGGSTVTSLPQRVSSATFHPNCGFVVGVGKRILTIPPSHFMPDDESSSGGGIRKTFRGGRSAAVGRSNLLAVYASSNKFVDFSSTILPPPGVRTGEKSLTITSGGNVAIVVVGNTVYAVPGIEVDSSANLSDNAGQPNTPRKVGTGDTAAGCSSGDGFGATSSSTLPPDSVKVISFGQSSQIHPAIIVDIDDRSMDADWSSILVANGRECAVIDLQYDRLNNSASVTSPRSGVVTMASPILSAASSWPFLTLLTSDGLVSVRSPSCLAIPLKTIEVGTRPNDFFTLKAFGGGAPIGNPLSSSGVSAGTMPWILCMSYSGQAKVLQCKADSSQDLADRLMRLSIDAFGSNGFPRNQLAEALNASFTATSYVGPPEPTPQARNLLRQYLEAILGLADFEGGASSGWPTELNSHKSSDQTSSTSAAFTLNESSTMSSITGAFGDAAHSSTFKQNMAVTHAESAPVVTPATPNALLTATALLCLVCTQLTPSPKGFLANRAAKLCAAKMGVVILGSAGDGNNAAGISNASIALNEMISEILLREAAKSATMGSASSSSGSKRAPASTSMEFIEAATWLLRSCGRHERAIDIMYERLQQQNRSSDMSSNRPGFWSQIKYESYTATHLSELWATRKEAACRLVLNSQATIRLLEHNPRLGLNVFTVNHPQNASAWKALNDYDDPLAQPTYPSQVVQLLKSINPTASFNSAKDENESNGTDHILPIESGRALAVTFLESAIGISTDRPTEEDEFDALQPDEYREERLADFHDELCYLLLEGVISERGDLDNPQSDETVEGGPLDGDTTALGRAYRFKLRRLLRWPLAKIRYERLLDSLPKSFMQEKALVLGQLGRVDEALRILYCDCKSLDLALQYCDMLHQWRESRKDKERSRLAASGMLDDLSSDDIERRFEKENAYLPLVRVALEADDDKERGTAAAIQILALRRGEIDRAAALRLLPANIPVSAVARPFLIPALVESAGEARRLKVVSSLLRARHIGLKQQLTDAQLKAQSSLQLVSQLKVMNLGEPLHSTKPFKARPASSASSTFPDVVLIKHFFPRHVVIQAKVTNNANSVDGRALGNISFVVAESSEESIQPSTLVPIKVLPYDATGCAWCVLVASPHRMEGTAILTCELRYTVMGVDATSGTPLSFGHGAASGRAFVEELQDVEIFASHFS